MITFLSVKKTFPSWRSLPALKKKLDCYLTFENGFPSDGKSYILHFRDLHNRYFGVRDGKLRATFQPRF